MSHINHSPWKPENEDNSMEWEEDKGIERLDACVGEDGTSLVDSHVASEYAFSQNINSVCSGQKRKYSFSSPMPSKISRNIWYREQKEEHPSVNETSPCNDREVTSEFSITPPVSQMMIVDSLDNSCQATNGNTSATLANDDTNYSKGEISTASMSEIGAVSYPNREILNFPDHDVAKEKITPLLDTEGSSPDREDLSAKTKRSPPDTEKTSPDTEGSSPDTAGTLSEESRLTERTLSDVEGSSPEIEGSSPHTPSKIEGTSSDREGSSTDTEDPLSKTKGSPSGTKGSSPDTVGSSPETDRALSDTERILSDTEGSSPDIEGSSPDIEGSSPDIEGSSPDTEGSSPGTEGSSPGTEGSSPDTVGSSPETDRALSDTERILSDIEGSSPDIEGSSPDTEGSSPGTEGSSPDTEEPTSNREVISIRHIPPSFYDLSNRSLEILRDHLKSHKKYKSDAIYEYFVYLPVENEFSCKICEMYASELSPPISPRTTPSPPY